MRRTRPFSRARDLEQDYEISDAELARFLKRGVATLYRHPRTGNPALSRSLEKLASALASQGNLTVHDTGTAFHSPLRQGDLLGRAGRLENLSHEEIRRTLGDERATKADLIRLGAERFAISRSRLERLGKEEIVHTIWSALRNEESLEIISQEAQRGGTKRSS
jgi:hypothetical protein